MDSPASQSVADGTVASATGLARDAAAVRRAVTSLASRTRVERHGVLTTTQVAVPGRLVKVGDLTPGELARQLRTKPQSLTRTLNWLAAEGYLVRTTDPIDHRQSVLTITAAGLDALRAEIAPRDRWLAQAMATELTPVERGLLVMAASLMDRLAEIRTGSAPAEENP